MMQSYTELDLLRFVYKEVEVCEYFEMNFAIEEDDLLKKELQAIKNGISNLPEVSFQPSSFSVENILGYATA